MSDCALVTNVSEHDASMDVGSDKSLFEPTVDMMVNDFDDERTLDEEEALAAGEQQDPKAELNSLQKEGDMPLEELLALYGYDRNMEKPIPDQVPEVVPEETERTERAERTERNESALSQLYNENANPEATRCLRSGSRPPSEEEDDYDYSPDEEDWKKTIMVGSDYQAAIPEGLCSYDDALPYENEDKLLWNPSILDERITEEYMRKVCALNLGTGIELIPKGKQLRDDEEALYLLQQCGHNAEEALRRKRISAQTPPHASLWSEEECRNFENGLKAHGKDFHLIRQNKVRTRSVGELVQFYYIWKKTERHDIFANKARLEKKKYTLHPGHTDYMDRFLEEQEASGGSVVRPASPSPMMDYATSPVTQPDPLALGEKEVFSQLNTHNTPPRAMSTEEPEADTGP
ncbi:mesoderm induction early response protein 1 [Bombyx mandarina]|uniref:Mesoderm induction early response protein 1 n=2 Tax=Bombyx TaxID=7090 RepID=A0A8R1WM35_BOMMO|nr:mesoderm induction early response protein 1 [Bombyx mori]XP_028030278.1 mesoderm induction early response protein 1 [Bombyx mandarina]